MLENEKELVKKNGELVSDMINACFIAELLYYNTKEELIKNKNEE